MAEVRIEGIHPNGNAKESHLVRHTTRKFIEDAEAAGLEVEPYAGRFFWKGPAVRVDGVGEFHTTVNTQSDNMGLGFIVYPVSSDEEWYDSQE
jgi:hypothetical protein